MQLSTDEIIIILEIVTFAFAIIVLYHLAFVAVNLRKILGRVDSVTKQLEEVVLKPISMADAVVDHISSFVEDHQKKADKKTAKKPVKVKKTTVKK